MLARNRRPSWPRFETTGPLFRGVSGRRHPKRRFGWTAGASQPSLLLPLLLLGLDAVARSCAPVPARTLVDPRSAIAPARRTKPVTRSSNSEPAERSRSLFDPAEPPGAARRRAVARGGPTC